MEAIVEACDAPLTTMGGIAERVGHEPALAAIVLRDANSAYDGFGRRVETLPDACLLVAIATIRTLALTNAAVRFASRRRPLRVVTSHRTIAPARSPTARLAGR